MNKSKLATIAITSVVTIGGMTMWNLHNEKENIVQADTTNSAAKGVVGGSVAKKVDGIVFQDENVVIKYYDNGNQQYDILVETKNGTNISSEWNMVNSENHAFAYLVGNNKQTKKEFFDKNLKKLGYEWNWEENYPIEGVDTPMKWSTN